MICPKCKGDPRQIGITARPECVLMRWECNKCRHRYTTVEQIADSRVGYTCLSCAFFAHDANFCVRHGKNTYVKSKICKNFAKKQINPVMDFGVYSLICEELAKAKEKHPHFADTDAEAGTVIAEELLEVNTAALRVMQGINDKENRDNLFIELAQLNATTIRMMERLLNS
jgi:hypothetical protein